MLDDIDILLGLNYHVIGKCEKHLKFYKEQTANRIIERSTIGIV